jgi:LysR family transcriptional regulator, transcriptional activator of nhaA
MRTPVPRLNFQHLLYFWAVVRNGSLTKACTELHLSAPTVSAQLRTFEERIGVRLLMKSGRTLVPSEAGRLVFSYAEEIFALGADLVNALAQRPTQKPMRIVAGIDDVVPKEIAQRLVNAALDLAQPVQLLCREGTLHELLRGLELRELDVVLSDSPVTPSLNLRAYNHYLGGCDVSWMAAPALAKSLRAGFPKSLHGAPVLLPTSDTAIRRALDQWLDRHEVRPVIAGEFEDYALLREFARAGRGVAPVPSVLVKQLRRESGLRELGPARKVRGEFYAISMERNIKHPAVLAICKHAAAVFEPPS